MFDILEREFGIKLKIFYHIQAEPQDQSVLKLKPLLAKLDPWVLTSLSSLAQTSKSTALSMAFLLTDEISITDAAKISRLDENYQSQVFGRVEGAHDLADANTLTTFATAKTVLNLS